MSAELLDIKSKIESDLESRVISMLSKAVGNGKVTAEVNVALNQKKVATIQESVDPDATAVLGSAVEEESLNGARTNPAGIPGARANLPGADDLYVSQFQTLLAQNNVAAAAKLAAESPNGVLRR